MTEEVKKVLPRVEIGLNVIALHNIDDSDHSFECNFLIHVAWFPDIPLKKNDKIFIPWIQFHNLKEVRYELQNTGLGLRQFTEDYISEQANKEKNKPTVVSPTVVSPTVVSPTAVSPTAVSPTVVSHNYVASFISELDLVRFPFDSQQLRITVISGKIESMNLTHKVEREYPKTVIKRDKDGSPWKDPKKDDLIQNPRRTIKCNLEGDTMSEWSVLLEKDLAKYSRNESACLRNLFAFNSSCLRPVGMFFWFCCRRPNKSKNDDDEKSSDPAVAVYEFRKHDAKYSSEGQIYQRLDFYVVANRQAKNFLLTVILPNTLLSGSSLASFSLSIDNENNVGNRLTILFTIVLAVIANSIAMQGRLPRVDYFTWADWTLAILQYFLYAVIIETAACEAAASVWEINPVELDLSFFYAFSGIFVLILLIMFSTATYFLIDRVRENERVGELFEECFWKEEDRLYELETGHARWTDPRNPETRHYDENAKTKKDEIKRKRKEGKSGEVKNIMSAAAGRDVDDDLEIQISPPEDKENI